MTSFTQLKVTPDDGNDDGNSVATAAATATTDITHDQNLNNKTNHHPNGNGNGNDDNDDDDDGVLGRLRALMSEMTTVVRRFASGPPPSTRDVCKLRQALLLIRRVLTTHISSQSSPSSSSSAASHTTIAQFHRLQFDARPWIELCAAATTAAAATATTAGHGASVAVAVEAASQYVLFPPNNSTCLNPRLDLITCTGNGLVEVLANGGRHGPAGISTINVSHMDAKKSSSAPRPSSPSAVSVVGSDDEIKDVGVWESPVVPMAVPVPPSVLGLASPVCEGSQCVVYVRPSFEAALLSNGRHRTSYLVVQIGEFEERGPDIMVVSHAESQLQPMTPVAFVNVTPPVRNGGDALTLYIKLPSVVDHIGPFLSLHMMNRRRRRAIGHCIHGLWLIHVNEGDDDSSPAYPPPLTIDTGADDARRVSSADNTPTTMGMSVGVGVGGMHGGGGSGRRLLVPMQTTPSPRKKKKAHSTTLPSPTTARHHQQQEQQQQPTAAVTPVNVAPEWQSLNATLSHIEESNVATSVVDTSTEQQHAGSEEPCLLPVCRELPTELMTLLKMIVTRPLHYVALIQKACEGSGNESDSGNGSISASVRGGSGGRERRGRFEMAVLLNHLLNAFVINRQPMRLFRPLFRQHEGASTVADADALMHAYSPLAILVSLYLTEHCTTYLRDVLSKSLQEIFEHFMTHATASYEINPLQLQVRRPELRSKSSLRARSDTLPATTTTASGGAAAGGAGAGGGDDGGTRHVADILMDNATLMTKHYSLIMDRVVASAPDIQRSPHLHAMLVELVKLARPKSPEVRQEKIARALISSAMFSRFMCLAIINPTSSYVLPESLQLPPRLVRGLLLMAKCVQSTGNLARFDENDTDQYMMIMNDTIARYFPKVKKVYKDIITMPVAVDSKQTEAPALDELQLSLEALRIFLTRQSNAHLDLPDIEMDMDVVNHADGSDLTPYPLETSAAATVAAAAATVAGKPMADEPNRPPQRKHRGLFARLFSCAGPSSP